MRRAARASPTRSPGRTTDASPSWPRARTAHLVLLGTAGSALRGRESRRSVRPRRRGAGGAEGHEGFADALARQDDGRIAVLAEGTDGAPRPARHR
ncbi:hypothetical protein, partial [Streptomyces sp. NPDC001970]